jgi:hypothetical protein
MDNVYFIHDIVTFNDKNYLRSQLVSVSKEIQAKAKEMNVTSEVVFGNNDSVLDVEYMLDTNWEVVWPKMEAIRNYMKNM